MFSEQGVVGEGEAFEECAKARVAGVAEGDKGVAEEATVLGALDRRVGEEALEVGFGEGGEPVEGRMEEGIVTRVP